ncbi:MAG: response regulator [Actinobacteria bacterium]|nr:response regulator [Actinomycetota bacterium]
MATVLVVDDEPDIRDIVRINLERDGHRVLTADGGPEGLEIVRRERPDLVILDVMMPGLDGWEVLTSIKGESEHEISDVPVLMLTARSGDMDRIRGGIEGALRYIQKPFSTLELREEVRKALEGDPEPVKRRRAQQEALESLARLEKGEAESAPESHGPRPRLTRLEHAKEAPEPAAPAAPAIDLGRLSPKQLELLRTVGGNDTVRAASVVLGVSRSNVYASLRRIARKLGVPSVPDLLTLARGGSLFGDGAAGAGARHPS